MGLEDDLKHALKMNDSQENNLEKDIVMFNQEIARLTKERDGTKLELEVVKNDMKRVEGELSKSKMEINKLLSEKDKFSVRDSGLEKGQKEIMEQKDNEIKKLTE